ncbi:unnamed protein product [Ceratitis capitata]|uniref:(Mediterranean fruit fly) hypothetical protein n=1 Tax=Ceratitis capitata TaxID=7213 RepID=A0A811V0I9_CERCA|nr:unnamed protein product [Ceratitis capitata]
MLNRSQSLELRANPSSAVHGCTDLFYTTTTTTAVHRESGESGEWLYNCTDESVDTSNSTLKLVHIVLRHGARTPVTTYPNDPYVNETYSPYGWGHLTNRAKTNYFSWENG